MPNIIAKLNDQLDEFAPKRLLDLTRYNDQEKYQTVKDILEEYGASTSPSYSGHGLEVYATFKENFRSCQQIVIDWDSETIKIK